MTWGWLIASLLILTVGLSMGELASAMPTSGGLYYWTYKLGPSKHRAYLAWVVGYMSCLGNIAATSSLAWAAAGIFLAAATLNNPDYSPTTATQFGCFIGVLLLVYIVCAYFTAALARCQNASIVLNACLILVTVIGVPIGARNSLNPASYPFTHFENLTGYNNGFAFMLSFLSAAWTICSFDSAVSISEEATNAATAVPVAIVGAISIAGITGWLVLVIMSLAMGPVLMDVYNSDQPLALVYFNAYGTKGALAIWSFMCIAQILMTLSLALPASRQAFAFARDGALPFSRYFYNVNKWSGTPVRTVGLICGASIPLGALGFASDAAINAIFSLAIQGPYVAYAIPICCLLFDKGHFKPGPWSLGKASKPIAAIAVLWMTFAFIIFCFPADVNPDATTMNYAIVVWAGVFLGATVWYYLPGIGGKTFFHGPVMTAEVVPHDMPPYEGRTLAEEGSDGVSQEGSEAVKA